MAWALSQLLSYSVHTWLLFLLITIAAAYIGRGCGIVAGHIMIAFAVLWFDVRWIQAEMNSPGWDGVPDLDIIFQIGVLLRVVLINTVLLPLALFVRWMPRRRIKSAMQPVA